jgi:hypothetical protein
VRTLLAEPGAHRFHDALGALALFDLSCADHTGSKSPAKASTLAPVALPARPVRGVTCLHPTKRRGLRMASGPNSTKRVGAISKRPNWKRRFDDPILLPDGRKLVTLRDAATYITALPKKEADCDEWQAAIEALMLVAKSGSGPTMLARIGVMQALNRHVERVFNPDRKEHHWGKRKLARDR